MNNKVSQNIKSIGRHSYERSFLIDNSSKLTNNEEVTKILLNKRKYIYDRFKDLLVNNKIFWLVNNQNLYLNVDEFAKMTSNAPMVIHINPSGLIRLGSNNERRFDSFRKFINSVENLGGNILIPTFSYSFVGGSMLDLYITSFTHL